jgi:adenylate cyclase
VTVQLIDALAGNHLWAERYDRDLQDLFALQDEITMKVLAGVQIKLMEGGDVSRFSKFAEKYFRGRQGLDCYLKLVEANDIRLRGTIEDNNRARRMIEEVTAECPENPMSYVALGWVYYTDYNLGNTIKPGEPLSKTPWRGRTLEKAIELAQKALAMEDSSSAHALLCFCYYNKWEFVKAVAEGERAVALNPGGISALNAYAVSLTGVSRAEEAIPIFQKAIRLNPFGPSFSYRTFGFALRNVGRFEEAVSAFTKAIQIAPDDMMAHLGLTGVYIMMGLEREARAEAAEVLRINPKFLEDSWAKGSPYKDQSEAEKIDTVLRKAQVNALAGYGTTLGMAGRYAEAIPILQKANRLSPSGQSFYRHLGGIFRNAGRFEEAISAFKKAIEVWSDDLSAHTGLTATYIMMGREREARAEAAEVLRINPKFSVDSWANNLQYKQSERERIAKALRKAGLK